MHPIFVEVRKIDRIRRSLTNHSSRLQYPEQRRLGQLHSHACGLSIAFFRRYNKSIRSSSQDELYHITTVNTPMIKMTHWKAG